MKKLTCSEAEEMFRGNPFSFIEMSGTRTTILTVCYTPVITAANCVRFDPDYRSFEISTSLGW
jgi:hypothetical protein